MGNHYRRVVKVRLSVDVNGFEMANQVQFETDLTSLTAAVGSCGVSDGALSGKSGLPTSRRVGRARFRALRVS